MMNYEKIYTDSFLQMCIRDSNEGFEKYNIEDGNFRTGERLYRGQREAIEEKGVKVYENYYIEDTLTNGSTMRFFKNLSLIHILQCKP